MRTLRGLALAAAVMYAGSASAAGYEKSIMWGGRTGSVAGISTSYINGADALYFNPAGLMKAAPGQDLSLNVSPVTSNFSGPYNNNNDIANSKAGFTAPFGLIYSNTPSEKWAFGVGGFISGGSKVKYENIDFPLSPGPAQPQTPLEAETDLTLAELSAGAAFKLMPNLRFGLAYRYVMARASFSFLQRASAGAVANIKLSNLKDQQSGLRAGVQYDLSEKTHFGLTYRSEINLNASGDINGEVHAVASTTVFTPTTGSAQTTFPQAVTVGADHSFNDVWRGLAEVAWTQYSRVDNVAVKGLVGTAQDPRVIQNWKDQWNFRLGGEYVGWSWPLRFGYGLTTQVTATDWARPTFTPPGVSHTLTVGSGKTIELGGQKLDFNGAGEYTFVSGDGTGAAAGTTSAGSDIRAGTHNTSSFAAHLGLAYNF